MIKSPITRNYRNLEAFQIFQEHSTHLRKEREQEQAKRQVVNRGGSRKQRKDQTATHAVKVSPRDPLLDYKREGVRWRRTHSWGRSDDKDFVPKGRRSSPTLSSRLRD